MKKSLCNFLNKQVKNITLVDSKELFFRFLKFKNNIIEYVLRIFDFEYVLKRMMFSC